MNTGLSMAQIIDIARTDVGYNNDFWANFPFVNWFYTDSDIDTTSYDPSYGATEWFYTYGYSTLHNSGTFGFASYTMAQEPLEVKIEYYPLTIGKLLGEIGSRAIGLFGIFYFLISSYEGFSFDKSAIKSFYFSESETFLRRPSTSGQTDDHTNQLRKEMYLTKEFSMGYLSYMALRFFSSFCCCLRRLCDRENSWYRQGIIRLNRLKVAKAKL